MTAFPDLGFFSRGMEQMKKVPPFKIGDILALRVGIVIAFLTVSLLVTIWRPSKPSYSDTELVRALSRLALNMIRTHKLWWFNIQMLEHMCKYSTQWVSINCIAHAVLNKSRLVMVQSIHVIYNLADLT